MTKDKGIAIEYNGEIPKVLSSVRGHFVERMIAIAKEKDIPVYSDPDLAEVLINIEPGKEIPEDLFIAVSEVLAYCYSVNNKLKFKIDRLLT